RLPGDPPGTNGDVFRPAPARVPDPENGGGPPHRVSDRRTNPPWRGAARYPPGPPTDRAVVSPPTPAHGGRRTTTAGPREIPAVLGRTRSSRGRSLPHQLRQVLHRERSVAQHGLVKPPELKLFALLALHLLP